MIAIARLYQDSYGPNMGARTFCQLSKYFGGVLVTDNKKIKELDFPQLTHREAIANIKKFTKLILYNTKANLFGGIAPKHSPEVVRLIREIPDVYFYNCDPILDLQKSVPNSHEIAIPGLTSAIHKLNNFGTKLDRTNTDLTKFLAAQLKNSIVKTEIEKEFLCCYFGDKRNEYRQEQVINLFMPIQRHSLIIGHEHKDFAWFNYTPDFYELLSKAWTTPIIGDKKLHYETGIPSLRLYEACASTAIPLIDSRLPKTELDERFYFSTPEEFVKKTTEIALNKELYLDMLKTGRKFLNKTIKKFSGKKFDWSKIKKEREDELKQRSKKLKKQKKNIVEQSRKRLINKGILKPKRKKK